MRLFSLLLMLGFLIGTGFGFLMGGEGETPPQLPPDEYAEQLERADSAIIIDVRTIWEYRNHRMEGAVNIPFPSINYWQNTARLDTSKTAFIYCHSAHRSPFVGRRLKKLGFDQVYDLKGGLQNWIDHGYPVKD